MERNEVYVKQVGANAWLVIYQTDNGYVHCLEYQTQATDDVGPFETLEEALQDAHWYSAVEWAEQGWNIDVDQLVR